MDYALHDSGILTVMLYLHLFVCLLFHVLQDDDARQLCTLKWNWTAAHTASGYM